MLSTLMTQLMRFRSAAPLLSLVLALALLGAACGDDAADLTTTIASSTTAPEETPTTLPISPDGNAGDAGDEVAALVPIIEELRGLRFLDVPEVTVLNEEELGSRIQEKILSKIDPAELAVDQAYLELLGMLDGSVDLATALPALYAEQIGGFYDGDTDEMVVLGGQEITPLTRMIMVHELIHALTDQHFGWYDTVTALSDAERHEESVALQALYEGDATYFQVVYMQALPANDQLVVAAELFGFDTSVADSLPAWLNADLAFAYDAGFAFVTRLVADGGIAAVDQAYRHIPETTEQILDPPAYFTFEPGRPVVLLDTSLAGYEVHAEGTFGQWNLSLLIENALGVGNAAVASDGWGGDEYRILSSGTEIAFMLHYEGDTPRDAEELEAALLETIDEAMAVGGGSADDDAQSTTFTGADYAFVQRVGSTVVFVAASDPIAGTALVEMLQMAPPADGT